MKKIILMRHGQPEVDLEALKNNKISSNHLGELVGAYEKSALAFHSMPPEASIEIADSCDMLFSSDLSRSIESAQKLIKSQQHVVDKCFKESSLPYLKLHHPKFSLFAWAMIYRVLWFLGFSKNGEPIKQARVRAKLGANKLVQMTQAHQSVLLLGHGIMNRLIAKELESAGWYKTISTGEKYWSYRVYQQK